MTRSPIRRAAAADADAACGQGTGAGARCPSPITISSAIEETGEMLRGLVGINKLAIEGLQAMGCAPLGYAACEGLCTIARLLNDTAENLVCLHERRDPRWETIVAGLATGRVLDWFGQNEPDDAGSDGAIASSEVVS